MGKRSGKWAAGIVVGLVVGGVAAWLGSPFFIDRIVDEAAPGLMEPKQGMMEPNQSMMGAGMKDPMYAGIFRDGDSSHHAKGRVSLFEADSKRYLRFEEFAATNGPDLYVYLAKPGLGVTDGLNLGKLKGNMGNQNYELPPDADLMSHSQVVIWCRAFSVTFGTGSEDWYVKRKTAPTPGAALHLL